MAEEQTRYDKQVEKWEEAEQKKAPKKSRRNRGPSIEEIAVLARQEHLSYGQWVAKHEFSRG